MPTQGRSFRDAGPALRSRAGMIRPRRCRARAWSPPSSGTARDRRAPRSVNLRPIRAAITLLDGDDVTLRVASVGFQLIEHLDMDVSDDGAQESGVLHPRCPVGPDAVGLYPEVGRVMRLDGAFEADALCGEYGVHRSAEGGGHEVPSWLLAEPGGRLGACVLRRGPEATRGVTRWRWSRTTHPWWTCRSSRGTCRRPPVHVR